MARGAGDRRGAALAGEARVGPESLGAGGAADQNEWIENGELEILDIQPKMLEHTMRKVHARGLTNVSSSHADAANLPHADGSFDAALLVTVFGEIPDGDAALREVGRVLKPGGCLIIGEIAVGDPHFSRLSSLAC